MTLVAPIAGPADPLARLNPEQRAAVLHDGGPLLVIAGAGTGKTNTLVHRLAQLVLGGADPRRILLMTFSRRAAAEMTRRAERIAGEVMGPKAAVLAQGLTWAGTFHAIGARLLRDYAGAVGLDPGFTIHDREDSADLMNLARHRLGFSATERRFPTKGDLPRDLLAGGQRPGGARAGAAAAFPLVRRLGGRAACSSSRPTSRRSRRTRCSTTTTSCSTGPG